MEELFDENQPLTVTQITDLIKNTLEHSFSFITIKGEISNFKPSSTGHWYFTLKDDNAAISAVMFKGKSQYVSFRPKDGMVVELTGSISVYAARGSYQILVNKMKQSGQGDILQMLEERKKRLAQEGLFDEENKKPLPRYPNKIGVVTSPTGAALQDILNIAKRRNNGIDILVFPCAVQGESAALTIAEQIKIANLHNLVDVLIVGRGGGSLEDLLPFSEEIVVRAVAESKIPIVSAVGHEIDWAISDFAADVRAPTPSAAAELVIPQKIEIESFLTDSKNFLYNTIKNRIEKYSYMVKSFSVDSLELKFRAIEMPLLQRFDDAKETMLLSIQERIKEQKHKLELLQQQLENNSPLTILSRGYSIVKDAKTGNLITSNNQVASKQQITVATKEGSFFATVD